jgi:DNA-binding response OmpR family regulator
MNTFVDSKLPCLTTDGGSAIVANSDQNLIVVVGNESHALTLSREATDSNVKVEFWAIEKIAAGGEIELIPVVFAIDVAQPESIVGVTLARIKSRFPQARLVGLVEWQDLTRASDVAMAAVEDLIFLPAHPGELKYRLIRNLHSAKTQSASATQLKFGPLQFDMQSLDVSVVDKRLRLTKKEFEVLLYLARNANRPVSLVEIAEQVWLRTNPQIEVKNVLSVHIARIRQKLTAAGCVDRLKTERGVGVCLNID